MHKLNDHQLDQALAALPGWKLEDGTLIRDYTLADFAAAMAFVNRIAGLAEAAGHHPDIDIRYNRVRLALVTHDAGGITANDTKMAATIDQA
jgi:4a-hydroxytetrahydrobiopterin dehydratase